LLWAQKNGATDFINMLNDAGYTALDSLPYPRRRWLPASSPNFSNYYTDSGDLTLNAELLMALGARVSRKVVILLRLMVMPPESRWQTSHGSFYEHIANSAAWVYESQRAMDTSVIRTNATLPDDIAVIVNENRSRSYDTAHRERFARAIESLNETRQERIRVMRNILSGMRLVT